MKRSLCKTSSTPEPLPRISFGKKTTSSKRQPESKSRHYSNLDISPWRPLTEEDTMALPVVLHNRPTHIDKGRPSEKQGSLSDRSLPIRRHSDVSFTQGMVTILRKEDEADDNDKHARKRLHAYYDQDDLEESPRHLHQAAHSHSNGLELATLVNPGLGINHSLGGFHHSEEGKHHLHIRVPANKESPRRPVPVHQNTHGVELGTYVNSGLGINQSLGRFHHSEEGKHHLHIRVPANKEVPRRSPVPVHQNTHGVELGTYVNSGLGINHSLGRFHHSEEGKHHLHIRVPANKESPRRPVPVHQNTHGVELGTYENSGLGINHNLGPPRFHHGEERKNYVHIREVPQRRSVSVHQNTHGVELGTYANSGLGINHNLGHFHRGEEGKHSSGRSVLTPGGGSRGLQASPQPRHVSYDRHTHRPGHVKIRIGPPRTPTVSPTGDLGVPVRLGELGPRGDLPSARSSVRECGEQGISIHPRTLRDVQTEDEQKTQNDDAKPKLACPELTQEVLTSGLYSESEQTEDRVSDWLEECDGELIPTSLPPHLPEIDGQRRYKPSTG